MSTARSSRLDRLGQQISPALGVCVFVFFTLWTAVVYMPAAVQGSALAESGVWYAIGWIASAGIATIAGAIAYWRRPFQRR